MSRFTHLYQSLAAAAGLALLLAAAPASAADPPAGAGAQKDLVLRGDAKCTRCHDENDDYPVLAIGKTPHGTVADARTPTCTSCHGSSDAHVESKGATLPDVRFRGKHKSPSQAENGQCLNCHSSDASRTHWAGSMHEERGLACASCHQIHNAHDAVRDKRTQPEVCFTCHKEQRTKIDKPSHHPIPEGKMACSDCHNPHGSTGPKLLKRDSVNDTCYTCHMEKRGPFVHNHEPVSDDCTICHEPHGTTAENMLKARPPFLCHQCHTPHGAQVGQIVGQGQTQSFGGGSPLLSPTTSGKSGLNYFMARGCTNCHTEVHGTNNPSTANPSPQFNFR
ncbi:MAG TPA: DmsE family decaheme c-type cytochrome [Usitatibacter sp.]|nr:DmsE family decaheme c-type cytochrome [Usitatibacter sp.]